MGIRCWVYPLCTTTFCVPILCTPHFAPHTLRPTRCAPPFEHKNFAILMNSVKKLHRSIPLIQAGLYYFYRLCMHLSKISVMELIIN